MRTKLAAGVMAISAATIIAGAGLAAASAAPASPRTEHFRFMTTKATAVRHSVIATGAFTAGGYLIPAAVTDKVVLPGGTFVFRHVTHHVSGGGTPDCLLTETLRGTFTLGHGTGRYAGIRGSGMFVTSLVAVATKKPGGGCTHLAAPPTYQEITTATGTVSR
jgi:hypothetical protein